MKLSHQTIIEGRRVIKRYENQDFAYYYGSLSQHASRRQSALAYVTKQIDKMSPKLSGQEEVGPNASTTTGQLIIKVNQDATSMHYKLIVNNLADITASHIHLAAKGSMDPWSSFCTPGRKFRAL